MKKSLWFSTALLIAWIGTTAPATAQQYLEHYKVTEKPAVEVDMGALANAPQAPSEPQSAALPAAVLPAVPMGTVDQKELMRAASQDAPDKTLDKPFFTAMAPVATAETTPPVTPPTTIAAQPRHHMGMPPKPRHKPRSATITATDMPAVKPIPVETTQLENRPSLVTIPLSAPTPTLSLSLPSHMPVLAVDQAKMPPLPTSAPVVSSTPAYGLTAEESHTVALQSQVTTPTPVLPAQENRPATTELTAAQAADNRQSMEKALQAPETPLAPNTAIPPAPVTLAENAMPVVPKLSDLTLLFAGDSSDLSAAAQSKLDNLVAQLQEMAGGRIQVRGYATGKDGGRASARRISLSRVLSVRSYLMDKGIKPTRVDVRAQGSETDRSPLDRVDLLFER